MRVMVTGSRGLVGTELAAALGGAGHEVVEYDLARPGAGLGTDAGMGLEDIGDAVLLHDRMKGCDGVIHLAAVSRVAWGEIDPDLCYRVNVAGTETVIATALAQAVPPWVLFASSREVYGDPAAVPVGEDAPIAPANHYGRSKAAAERAIDAARGRGLRTAILRLSNVYGTAQDHPDRAVPSLLWNAMTNRELRITGADVFFDFVHVEDCVRAFVAVAGRLQAGERGLPPVHLATGVGTTLHDLAHACIRVSGSRSPLTVLPRRGFDVRGFCGRPDRAAALLGWTARIGLDEGLGRLRDILAERGRPPDPVGMPLVPAGAWRDLARDVAATAG